MRTTRLALIAGSWLAGLLLVAGCTSAPEQKIVKVEGNVVFRLGAKPDGIEVRLESSFYPNTGYELVTKVEGKELEEGYTIILEGVRVPLEPSGPRAPASAVVDLKTTKSIEGVTFPLCFKIPAGDGSGQLDAYTVQHTPKGWRLSRTQGGFSRFEAQGSY
ncbi:MAG: hypothetical protein ACAI25_04735 [Planctomycetota bacterium]